MCILLLTMNSRFIRDMKHVWCWHCAECHMFFNSCSKPLRTIAHFATLTRTRNKQWVCSKEWQTLQIFHSDDLHTFCCCILLHNSYNVLRPSTRLAWDYLKALPKTCVALAGVSASSQSPLAEKCENTHRKSKFWLGGFFFSRFYCFRSGPFSGVHKPNSGSR